MDDGAELPAEDDDPLEDDPLEEPLEDDPLEDPLEDDPELVVPAGLGELFASPEPLEVLDAELPLDPARLSVR